MMNLFGQRESAFHFVLRGEKKSLLMTPQHVLKQNLTLPTTQLRSPEPSYHSKAKNVYPGSPGGLNAAAEQEQLVYHECCLMASLDLILMPPVKAKQRA